MYTKQGGGPPCFCFDSVASTNLTTKEMLRTGGCPRVFAVSASEQTAGRGRYDRKFLSAKDKGVYITYARRISPQAGDVSVYGAVSSLAVCDALQEFFAVNCVVKWPNDVLCAGKKICGILPESVYAADGARYLLIGMGINLFYSAQEMEELSFSATSAVLQCKNKHVKHALTRDVAGTTDKMRVALVERTDALCNRCDTDLHGVVNEYAARLSTIGRPVRFTCGDGSIREGRACGVDEDGALLADCGGEIQRIRWGEVTVQ